MLDEGSAKAEPMTDRAARALLFSALMLIQVLAPLTTATPSQGPERVIDTDLDPILLVCQGRRRVALQSGSPPFSAAMWAILGPH